MKFANSRFYQLGILSEFFFWDQEHNFDKQNTSSCFLDKNVCKNYVPKKQQQIETSLFLFWMFEMWSDKFLSQSKNFVYNILYVITSQNNYDSG